jgi:NarL family two-component system sensor histidine kinase YdfH
MQQITTLPPATQPTYYLRPFLIVITLSSIGQFIWWLGYVFMAGSVAEPSPMPKVIIAGILWAIQILLHWTAFSLRARSNWAMLYMCTQCLLGFIINYFTRPYFMGFAFYVILVGEAIGVFQSIPLAVLSFALSLLSKEIVYAVYYQELYRDVGNLGADWFRNAMGTVFWGDFGIVVVNLPYVLAIYLQFQARRRTQTLIHQLDTAHREVVAYSAQVKELTLATERTRMARELHDTLAQGLVGVSLQLEALDAYLQQGNTERAKQLADQMKNRTRDALASSRTAIKDLRVIPTSEKPLILHIQEAVEHFSDSTKTRCVLDIPLMASLPAAPLPDETIAHILRCVTESLSNIERHANASQATVRVKYTEDIFDLTISDNGVGFELEKGFHKPGHYGLLGLRERARLIDGEVSLTSAPGRGTTVHLFIKTNSSTPDPMPARLAASQ